METFNWETFAYDLIVSLIGSLLVTGSALIWGYMQWWRPHRRLQKSGVISIYNNQQEAMKGGLINEILKTKNLRIMVMRGQSFSSSEGDNSLSKVLTRTDITQKYLISHPDNDYLVTRGNELNRQGEELQQGVNNSLQAFERAMNRNKSIEVRQHHEVVRFRIFLLDDFLYLSFQNKRQPGSNSQVLKITKDSSIYANYSSLFDDIWNKYK